MPLEKKVDAEPIRGYRLIEPLGTGGFGEVWKCEAPGGIFKAIKFVYGNLNGLSSMSKKAEEELRAVQHIKSIRHPFLLSIDRVESVQGELVIVTELADENLHQVLCRYQAQNQTGIPRSELLFYLREAAEVLDLLNVQSNLQHLDVKPRNLFLSANHVKVADFGLVQSLSLNQPTIQMGAITPLYAAPEIFLGSLSKHCDQYSLAIVYQELLTGTLPFDGKNTRQLLMQHTKLEPDLHAIPDKDRAVVARALQKNPKNRFASCMDFVRALQAESSATPHPLLASEYSINLGAIESNPADTQTSLSQDTQKLRRPTSPVLPPGVLPGHRFVESVVNSSLVETWKVQPAEGKSQLVHFIYGCTQSDAKKLQDLTLRLRSLQHPGLIPMDLVHSQPGRLIATTPIVKESLRERFQEYVSRKQTGIMRGELVDYLRAAAEVLDYLYQQHSVLHLGLNPRNLVLDHGWLQIAEFGPAHLVWLPSGQDIAQRNARYAAPELFTGAPGPASDQYSLALIYAEMLTGHHPFQGHSPRRRGAPDLEHIPLQDRDILARALHADPEQRWPSATEMVLALEGTKLELHKELAQKDDHFTSMLKGPAGTSGFADKSAESEDLHRKISDLLTHLGAEASGLAQERAPTLCEQEQILEHRLIVGLPLGSTRQHMEPFLRDLGGKIVHTSDTGCVVHLVQPGTFWQRWRSKEPILEVRLALARVHPLSATPVEVKIEMQTHNLDAADAVKLLETKGPPILDNLRKHLLVNAEKRTQERMLWPHKVQVVPVYPDGQFDDPVECRGKDISSSGMGLYFPHELDTKEVILEITNPVHPPRLSIPATLVRGRRCADGWYEVGALFHLPALRKSSPTLCLAQG